MFLETVSTDVSQTTLFFVVAASQWPFQFTNFAFSGFSIATGDFQQLGMAGILGTGFSLVMLLTVFARNPSRPSEMFVFLFLLIDAQASSCLVGGMVFSSRRSCWSGIQKVPWWSAVLRARVWRTFEARAEANRPLAELKILSVSEIHSGAAFGDRTS